MTTAKSSPGNFERIRIGDSEFLVDGPSSQKVLHVKTPHALTQAAGYLKYLGGQKQKAIYFRGQSQLHEGLVPTLFRGIRAQKGQDDRISRLNKVIQTVANQVRLIKDLDTYIREPLLQHYGLRTSWIDLVDNVWVALWFACHNAHTSGHLREFLHFERRVAHTNEGFAYILLIATDVVTPDPAAPGFQKGDTTELIDLRVACPSIFLRPHAQHGVLFRRRGVGVRRPLDYESDVWGIIRIELGDALKWLGEGTTLGTHALFRPPYYDFGYGFLLNCNFKSRPLRSQFDLGIGCKRAA